MPLTNPFESIELRLATIEATLNEFIADHKAQLSSLQDPNRFLTRQEVCRILNISLPTLNTYVKLGLIPGNKIGTRVLFRSEDISNCLKTIPSIKYSHKSFSKSEK